MSISIQSISDILVQGISAAPNQRILGARLGALLRTAYPGFSPADFQSRNLRQLIRTYVPAVEEKGRSGPDFIYGLALGSSGQVSGHPSVPSRFPDNKPSPSPTAFDWKAFSSPSYPFSLAANTETGEFQAIAGNEVSRLGCCFQSLHPKITMDSLRPSLKRSRGKSANRWSACLKILNGSLPSHLSPKGLVWVLLGVCLGNRSYETDLSHLLRLSVFRREASPLW